MEELYKRERIFGATQFSFSKHQSQNQHHVQVGTLCCSLPYCGPYILYLLFDNFFIVIDRIIHLKLKFNLQLAECQPMEERSEHRVSKHNHSNNFYSMVVISITTWPLYTFSDIYQLLPHRGSFVLLAHRGSFVKVKKISEKKMFKKMLYVDICVYYLILMIFVFVDVCMCVCVCVCIFQIFISPKRINRFSSGKAYSLRLAGK